MGTIFAKVFTFLLLMLVYADGISQLSTPSIYSSGMVLQREEPVPVKGTSGPGKKVIIQFRDHADSIITNQSGDWSITLPSMPAGGPDSLIITSNDEQLIYNDVYIGDVWLASGQSNMAWILNNSDPPSGELDDADYENIREFNVRRSLKNEPSAYFESGSAWFPATSEYKGNFSAVGYYFARYLNKSEEIPIGIINSSVGGSRIETWMSKEELGFDEQDIILNDGDRFNQPTLAYNGMLHPLAGFPVKGVIWYQGESNAGNQEDAVHYRYLFKKLIRYWRNLWDNPDLPFLWVQLANFNRPANESQPGTWGAWPILRESQASALNLPVTGQAVAIDLGGEDIHPTNKQPVGKRLSLAARKIVYGDSVVHHGPAYQSHRLLENGMVEISFNNPADSLVTINGGTQVRWFSIVRKNGSIVPAHAVIEDEKVKVWHDEVAEPYAIRYAWETNPVGVNLYNEKGLPAEPFYIYVNDSAVNIESFRSQKHELNRGQSTVLRWTVTGPVKVYLGDEATERKDGRRVWPLRDSTFRLRVVDTITRETVLEDSIRINVLQPEPTIGLSSDMAFIIPLDSAVIITPEVSKQGGAEIKQVAYFIDDKLVSVQSESPYAYAYLADTTGIHTIYATVLNDEGFSGKSNVLEFDVKELEFTTYEAEEAIYTSGAIIRAADDASGGNYLMLLENWTVTFDNIYAETSGEQLGYLRYKLNYGSPRLQELRVNDSLVIDLSFESEHIYNWELHPLNIPIDSGMNTLELQSVWGYMSLDYLQVGSEITETATDTTSTHVIKNNIGADMHPVLYPNPARNSTTLRLDMVQPGRLTISLYDYSGQLLKYTRKTTLSEGIHESNIDLKGLPPSIYYIRISAPSGNTTVRLIKSNHQQ